uniref:Uncharacterized protein n=1 Tax=Ditylenchus dipsaci TaxID=166011 RepID=A0A915DJQ4_9BILA
MKIAQRPTSNVQIASSSANVQEFQNVKILRGAPRREDSPQHSSKTFSPAVNPSPQIFKKHPHAQARI